MPEVTPIATPATAEGPDWIFVGEAARILGVHQETLARWADTGKVPMWRPHATALRRFDRAVIERIAAEGIAAVTA